MTSLAPLRREEVVRRFETVQFAILHIDTFTRNATVRTEYHTQIKVASIVIKSCCDFSCAVEPERHVPCTVVSPESKSRFDTESAARLNRKKGNSNEDRRHRYRYQS